MPRFLSVARGNAIPEGAAMLCAKVMQVPVGDRSALAGVDSAVVSSGVRVDSDIRGVSTPGGHSGV
ncbi:hypothetical protein [Roseovarius sp. D22-M7]|uniref:hypothetical protein n=1 Tax=Roseovarius sp. D22-M7 TaxID=3127116 RepID=UPI00300FE284